MKILSASSKRTTFFILACIFLLTVFAVVASSSFTPVKGKIQPMNSQPQVTQPPTTRQRMTLEGEVVCLPHKEKGEIQTMECAFGLLAEGNYYALDTNLLSSTPPDYTTGDRIKANGMFTPVEELSSNHWQTYDVRGIFSITDSLIIH